MYQFSRAIYRELAPQIAGARRRAPPPRSNHAAVLRACEAGRHAPGHRPPLLRPSRAHAVLRHPQLLPDVRAGARPPASSPATWATPSSSSIEHPHEGYTAVSGAPPQCRATTRKGSACQRTPLPHNGYCPSHQHLADTEDRELAAA